MLDVRAPGLGIVRRTANALYFGWGITGSSQVFQASTSRRASRSR